MNRHETVLNVSAERTRLREADGPLPWKKKPKRMYVSDEECAKGEEHVAELRRNFVDVVEKLATGDTLRFCREKEETAFGSRDNAKMVYQAAKKSLMGDKLANDIVTAADDKAAAEVFYWGLIGGEQGVANGSMPTGMADMDIRHKPKRNKGILN